VTLISYLNHYVNLFFEIRSCFDIFLLVLALCFYKSYCEITYRKVYIVQSSDGWSKNYLLYANNVSREKRTWNTDGVRVDKDLFKVDAILDIFLCSFLLFYNQQT